MKERTLESINTAMITLGITGDVLFTRIREALDRGLVQEARSHLNFVDEILALAAYSRSKQATKTYEAVDIWSSVEYGIGDEKDHDFVKYEDHKDAVEKLSIDPSDRTNCGWKPISSAPKDGREFIAHCPLKRRTRVMKWSKNFSSWIDITKVPAIDFGDRDLCAFATHWIDYPEGETDA
jgi:hypothetical protein